MGLRIAHIEKLFRDHGHIAYDGEGVTQLEHALQCAQLAENERAGAELVTAAFLHDIGHLLNLQGETPTERGIDDRHQYFAVPFIRPLFPPRIVDAIRLHVDAKRALCALEPEYYDSLSEDSRRSLTLQGGIFSREEQAEELCRRFEAAYEQTIAAAAAWARQRVLYLIWKSPWMTVARDTYISRMLATVGWDTCEIKSEARYPAFEPTPGLLQEEDVVLLSSEPYSFRDRHRLEILDLLPAHSRTRVALVDGSMTSWYGSRAIQGLTYLREFRRTLR